jgi:DNA mismatch endonuclease (patch repair protein)
MVRSMLHRAGFRFRLHREDLPGTPDLVFSGRGKIIFVHGCYWHRHPRCRYATTPTTRKAFWKDKFKQNVARDRRVIRHLKNEGWDVHIVWECELKDPDKVLRTLTRFLED